MAEPCACFPSLLGGLHALTVYAEQGVRVALDAGVHVGLLDAAWQPRRAAWTLVALGLAALVRAQGVLYVLLLPVLLIGAVIRLGLGLYQAINVVLDLALAGAILVFLVAETYVHDLLSQRRSAKRARLKAAETYQDYRKICAEVDQEEGWVHWQEAEKDFPQAVLLRRTMDELDEGLKNKDLPHLRFLVGGLFRRNHLGTDATLLHHQCLSGTKHLISRYVDKLRECLHFITASPDMAKAEKEALLRGARRSLGRTALCLSGGGSITSYHLGVVRALIEAGLFRYIRVLTGASGGSILAALLATRTEEELLRDVLTEDFSTAFKGASGTGDMKKEKIQWFFKAAPFPITRFLFGLGLCEKDEFDRTCTYYIGDMTFAEAFAKTRRHVTISVSSSSLDGYSGTDELLLNHLTTPNVLVRSAVVASCSLPGIMKASKLLSKNALGEIGPFFLDGVQWIDGSIQADIPFRGISTMFSVSNTIVSQVNFHVVPVLADDQVSQWLHKTWYWELFKMLASDIKYRAVSMQQLGLFPTFFGQDVSGVFRQRYSGEVTIIPPFRFLDSWGTNAILVPGKEEMRYYIDTGKRSCWKHLSHVKHLMAIEMELARCMAALAHDVPVPPLLPSLSSGPSRAPSLSSIGRGLSSSDHHHLGSRSPPSNARQLSLGASIVSDLDELEEDLLSVPGLLGIDGQPLGETGYIHDEDLVNPEFKFVGRPSRKGGEERGDGAAGATGAGGQPPAPPALTPASRSRLLSQVAGETIMSALTGRLEWLERENAKLTETLSRYLGQVGGNPLFDQEKLWAAGMQDEFAEDCTPRGEGLSRSSSSSSEEEDGGSSSGSGGTARGTRSPLRSRHHSM